MHTHLKNIAILASAATALLSAAPAFPSRAEAETVRVPFADLDLTTDRDAALLRQRVGWAATRVCRRSNDGIVAMNICRRDAMQHAAGRQREVILAARSESFARR